MAASQDGIVASCAIAAPRRPQRWKHAGAGFTLLELMVVVAIVGILVAIAVPAYGDAVRKSRRGQAKADLAGLAQRAERFHSVNNTYAGFWASVATGDRVSPANSANPAYTLTRDAGADTAVNSFVLTATPVGGQLEDTRCLALSLSHAGQKTHSGSASSAAECW